MRQSTAQGLLATAGFAALLTIVWGLFALSRYVVNVSEVTTMQQQRDPGILVPPHDVANGDLVVHNNRIWEVRVEPAYDEQGRYQGVDVELWPPGEARSGAAPQRTRWAAAGLVPDFRVRVVGRAR